MNCRCTTEMQELEYAYDGYDNNVGIWYWCSNCGRIFYKDLDKKHVKDVSFWQEPKLVSDSIVGKGE